MCHQTGQTRGFDMALLEQVYRLSGVPTYTFVEPLRYQEIKIAMRTPGRCIVIEGRPVLVKQQPCTRFLMSLIRLACREGTSPS